MKLLVAAGVLTGSVASGPTFGHAHRGGEVLHVHPDWDHHGEREDTDHQGRFHAMAWADEEEDYHFVVVTASQFHLHATLLGIPISLPVPADSKHEDGRRDQPSEMYLVPSVSADWFCISRVLERLIWLNVAGPALSFSSDSLSPTVAIQSAPSNHFQQYLCALQTQSGVLRC
jgi:hypothetical protein